MTHLSTLMAVLAVVMLLACHVPENTLEALTLLRVDKSPYLPLALSHDMRASERHMTYRVASFAVSTTLTPHETIPADLTTLNNAHSKSVCIADSTTKPASALPPLRPFRVGAPPDFGSRIGRGNPGDALLEFFQF